MILFATVCVFDTVLLAKVSSYCSYGSQGKISQAVATRRTKWCIRVFGRLEKRAISFGLKVKRTLYDRGRVLDEDHGAGTERVPRLVRRPDLLQQFKERRRLGVSMHIDGEEYTCMI